MTGWKWAAVGAGASLVAAGLAIALVGWVGLETANQAAGVAGAVLALLGLGLTGYGIFVAQPDRRQGVLIEDTEIGGDGVVINQAGNVRVGFAAPTATATPAAPASLAPSPLTVQRTKVAGEFTVVNTALGDVEVRRSAS